MKRPSTSFVTLFAALSLLAGGAYGDYSKNKKNNPDAIGDRDVGSGINFYSLEKEIALGKQLATEVEKQAKIVARPKIGTRVRPRSEWNLLDPDVLAWHLAATPSEHLVDELFALRQMVEPPAAALAASAAGRERSSGSRRPTAGWSASRTAPATSSAPTSTSTWRSSKPPATGSSRRWARSSTPRSNARSG